MTRAEERALKAYPPKRKEVSMSGAIYTVVGGDFERRIFQQGYEQAEKDLALTWEDAQLLYIITEKYLRELDKRIEAFPSSSQEVFEEILRKYKEAKK